MTRKIFRSICFAALLVFASSLFFIMSVLYDYFSDVQLDQLKMQISLVSQGVANEGLRYFEGLDSGHYRITWMDADGTILYDSASDTAAMENHLEREEIQQALADGYGESDRYSATLMERSFYVAQRMEDGSVLRLCAVHGTILVLLLGMSQPIFLVFAIAIILSILLAARLSNNIVKPLNELDLDNPLAKEHYEELTPLLRRIGSQQNQIRHKETQLQQKQEELHAVLSNLLFDITEKEKAEQLRREFTANVSHELKTPLHCISGYAELLKNQMVKEADICPFADKIYTEAQRMTKLVEDIMNLSHLDEGAADMDFESLDLYAVAESAVQSLAPEADDAGVMVTFSGHTARMQGIPQLLFGIVFNLCDNAVKYNHRGGNVWVEVQSKTDTVTLTVRDTGIGILQEHQEHIFERFYRVDKSHSKELGGTGLGLSIVKHAAKIHHAQIRLHSVPGEGTDIAIVFPKEL